MHRLIVVLTLLFLLPLNALSARTNAPEKLQDLYFGETLYYAFQEEWFDAITRLDTELRQHHGLDQPELDSLFPHIGLADFAVGDFELAYRMHQRAGRAISAVINGQVEEPVRNEAIYRLARILFQKDQPINALHALERISGDVPKTIRNDLAFLRTQVLMANGRFAEAIEILTTLQDVKNLHGFSGYNLGIALLLDGKEQDGRHYLDLAGRIETDSPMTLSVKDKANLVLGDKLLEEENFDSAKEVLDRVRLEGPFSNQALLGSGWADASQGRYQRALVPWTLLSQRQITNSAVQEAMLAVPYAYGQLDIYSKAALLYGKALQLFGQEIDKLSSSIKHIREGKFLQAIVREELKQDKNWVVKLRELPETPETYYLLDLMASHDFQESLKNYLDLEQLRRKLERWSEDLHAYAEMVEKRRAYYQPLLPEIDKRFQVLDSQMRLRLQQRDHIERRLQAMLVAPRPEYLATEEERIAGQQINHLEELLHPDHSEIAISSKARLKRLRGLLDWNIRTDYHRRLTAAHKNLHDLNTVIADLQQQYDAFIRVRQASTQSYQGYDETILSQKIRVRESLERVNQLMARQGHLLETMAISELVLRRDRLEKFQVKARFAMADSYDRATRDQEQKEGEE
ncbi:tetratricopeptide repeat protein [uncultured Desulfuromusa sp.]|uniref:tetratricopeptide repeat protein n=1 Tax=uncultured Desulfuromusa sp. TaxID=219183 RepID=UPI002AA719AE|nr:tetratricopeptide repeat protein [uncultured Desulfuromusa sp.]